MRSCPVRRSHVVAAAVSAATLALAISPASTLAARQCKSVRVDGQRVSVSATSISCAKARRIALRFSRDGEFVRGWTGVNPAGCEWVLMRRRDKDDVVENGYQAGPGMPVIGTSRMRGCTS